LSPRRDIDLVNEKIDKAKKKMKFVGQKNGSGSS